MSRLSRLSKEWVLDVQHGVRHCFYEDPDKGPGKISVSRPIVLIAREREISPVNQILRADRKPVGTDCCVVEAGCVTRSGLVCIPIFPTVPW